MANRFSDGAALIYSDNHSWLVAWLRSKVGCLELAADLAQDTFVRMLGKEGMPVIDEPRAYLRTVAKGLMIDYWRRRDIERAYSDALAALPEPLVPSAEEQAIVLEGLCRIDARLATLPAKVREVFVLARLEGKSYPEIADTLGISLITVKRHMQRVYMQLAGL